MTRTWLLHLAERLTEAADYVSHVKGNAAAATLRHAARIVTAIADEEDEPPAPTEFVRATDSEPNTDDPDPVRVKLTLSVEEAGQVLGISRGLAYELVARGEIPSIRLGRRVVVPKAALVHRLDSASEVDRSMSA